jgi:8-oxo-dGTP diphosphatase
VILSYHQGKLKILLQEKEEPIRGEIGLIGKLMLVNEGTDLALEKLLQGTLGFHDFYKKQLTAFSEVDRHPLGRVVSFAYYGLVPWEHFEQVKSQKLIWHDLYDCPGLCYDHNKILKTVIKRFRKGLLRHPTVFELLSNEFIISDVLKIYEQAFSKKIDSPNFRKQIRKSKLVLPLGKFLDTKRPPGRRPELYVFDKARYKQMKDNVQFNF